MYPAEIARTELLGNLAILTMGASAKYLLGLLVAFACLTTSIGLSATVGNFFSKHTSAKYEHIVIATCVFSMIVANFGVDKIVKLSIPILVFVFPISITLIVLNVFSDILKVRGAYIGGVLGAGLISMVEALGVMEIKPEFLGNIYNKMPFSSAGYAWIVPAILGTIIFSFLIKSPVNENELGE